MRRWLREMSEEKVSLTPFESYMENRMNNMWDKISELEKKIDTLFDEDTSNKDYDTMLYERIEKLEQEVKEWKLKYDDIEEAHKIWWDDLVSTHKEEINELKQIVDSQATLNDFYHKSINELKDQIAKLEGGEKS